MVSDYNDKYREFMRPSLRYNKDSVSQETEPVEAEEEVDYTGQYQVAEDGTKYRTITVSEVFDENPSLGKDKVLEKIAFEKKRTTWGGKQYGVGSPAEKRYQRDADFASKFLGTQLIEFEKDGKTYYQTPRGEQVGKAELLRVMQSIGSGVSVGGDYYSRDPSAGYMLLTGEGFEGTPEKYKAMTTITHANWVMHPLSPSSEGVETTIIEPKTTPEVFSITTPDGNVTNVPVGESSVNIGGTVYQIDYSSPNAPVIQGAPPGTTLSHLVAVGEAGKQDYVQKYQIDKLDVADQQILKTQGIEAFNSVVSQRVGDYENQVKTYLDETGGNFDYWKSLTPEKQKEYLNSTMTGYKNLGYDESMGGYVWEDEQGHKVLTATEVPPIFTPEVMATMGQEEQEAFYNLPIEQQIEIYGQQIPIAQEIIQKNFESTNVQIGNNEWMSKADYDSLPSDIKDTINKIGITGYKTQVGEAEAKLAPYETTLATEYGLTDEDLNNLTPGFRQQYTTPYYDLSKISYEEAQDPVIREAVAAIYPNVNLDQLGKIPIDSDLYRVVRDNPDSLIAKMIIPQVDDIQQLSPISKLTPTEYQNHKQALIDSGLSINEVDKEMSKYYMATGDIDEYQEYAKNQQMDVTFEPSMWQQMTPWREEAGEHVTLEGGMLMASDILIPGFYASRNWSKLSNADRALNIIIDAVSIIPFVGAVGLGARGVGIASRGARVAAIGRAVAREAVSQVTAPITMVIHPIGTIKATYRTITDVLENALDPRKLPEAVLTTSNNTIRLRVGKDVTLAEARAFGDELSNVLKSSPDEYPVVEIMNNAGEGVRIELPRSALMSEIKGVAASGTPFGQEWMNEIKTQGYAVVSSGADGKMYFSLEPHPRFSLSTAYGETGKRPVIMIFSKDNPLIQELESSGKLYHSPREGLVAEVEQIAREGTPIWKGEPAQILYTRVGASREVVEIWLDSPLSNAQIAKLKAKGLIESIKDPFRPPVRVRRFGEGADDTGLLQRDIRELADIIAEERSNINIAKGLRSLADSEDIFRMGLQATARNPFSLDRFDEATYGRARTIEARDRATQALYGREAADTVIRRTATREVPARIVPLRETPAREEPYREPALREEPYREEERISAERIAEVPRTTERPEIAREAPIRPEISRISPERAKEGEKPYREREIEGDDKYRLKMPGKYKTESPEKYTELTKPQRAGSVAWRQGKCYWLIFPPYGENDKITSGKPFPGMKVHKDAKSAFKTLTQIVEGTLPPTITRDMGIMDISIRPVDYHGSNVKHKLTMEYDLDRYQETTKTPQGRIVKSRK